MDTHRSCWRPLVHGGPFSEKEMLGRSVVLAGWCGELDWEERRTKKLEVDVILSWDFCLFDLLLEPDYDPVSSSGR